jgi:predicted regulator of amino acid metabolism with ACT domain
VWPRVRKKFERQRVRAEVVMKMIECGIRVTEGGKLYVGDVEVDHTAVARAVDVDRRVVSKTVEQIKSDRFLFSLFSRITPSGASLVNVVSELGYTAIVIEADPRAAGVIASVAAILARHCLVVRQALADDPDMVPDAKMTLVVEGHVPGRALQELNELKIVKSVKVLK